MRIEVEGAVLRTVVTILYCGMYWQKEAEEQEDPCTGSLYRIW